MTRLARLLLTAMITWGTAYAAPVLRRNVEIEFEAIEGASLYEVRVTRKEGGKPIVFKLRQAHWGANIRAGVYRMELRAFDDRGVPGGWSPPTEIVVKLPATAPTAPLPGATLVAKDDRSERVRLAWEPIPDARRYRVEVHGGDFAKTYDVADASEVTAELPVGRDYGWTITGVDQKGEAGETSSEPFAFHLEGPALAPPRPEVPTTRFALNVRWDDVAHAERYQTTLARFDRATKAWVAVPGPAEVKAGEYPLAADRAAGRYRLSVRALAAHRGASPVANLTFGLAGGFRDQADLGRAERRATLRRAPGLHASAALGAGAVTYRGRLVETNSAVQTNAAATTLTLGADHQGAGPWGYGGTLELSNVILAQQSFTAPSAEGHANYRFDLGPGVLTALGGLSYRTLPVVRGDVADGYASVGRGSVIGPRFGASFALPLGPRWGLRFDGLLTAGVGGNMTSGGGTEFSLSHELRALATLRRTRRWLLTGGLGQRLDQAKWTAPTGPMSFAPNGATDSVELSQIYLTVGAEFSF